MFLRKIEHVAINVRTMVYLVEFIEALIIMVESSLSYFMVGISQPECKVAVLFFFIEQSCACALHSVS